MWETLGNLEKAWLVEIVSLQTIFTIVSEGCLGEGKRGEDANC